MKELGVKTGVVTSDSVKSTLLTLKEFGWEDLFDVIVGRETSEYSKETGIPVRIALENLNSSADNTVMVGDTQVDLSASQNANLKHSILVATGQLTKQELECYSKYVLNSLDELIIV